MKQSRFKSKVLWVAVIGQVISLCQLTGIFAKLGLDAGIVGDTAAGIIQLLVILGILNDPTTKDSF